MTYRIQTFNNIAVAGLDRFARSHYEVSSECSTPDAILLRSHNLHDHDFDVGLKAVGRAGAGTNNIPVERLTEMGVPVFNAPGANANAVKELVIASIMMAERNIHQALSYTKALQGSGDALDREVENGKKRFVGRELPGRTLGVIGLGAIGVEVANAARALGMKVIGYDPSITVASAWRLQAEVEKASSVDDLLTRSEFVTFHVPLVDATRHMINEQRLPAMRDGSVIVNLSRGAVVDEGAILKGLDEGKIKHYITDFPTAATIAHERVITLPHLGASTTEAEENCAIMVADQIRAFLEHGHIGNAVNFPAVELQRKSDFRLTVSHFNVPNMLGQISQTLGQSSVNIQHLINESRDRVAYTVIDTECAVEPTVAQQIAAIEGVLKIRQL